MLRASILAVVMVGWMAAPALAAPTVLSTDPEEGETMHQPPGDVTVEFSEPLQESSGLIVKDSCGKKVSEGKARIGGPAMNELNVVVGPAPHRGTYTVEYVATGVTGTATGSFTFVVHGGVDCDGSGGSGDGGHGGHDGGDGDGDGGGNGGGNGNDGGHGGHGGSGGASGGDHDMSGRGSHPTSSDHSGMDMSGHGEHQDMAHKNNKKDSKKNRHANHGGNQRSGNQDDRVNPPLAAPGSNAIATDIPTGTTVVVALGLAVLMGLVGGWVLRVSSPS